VDTRTKMIHKISIRFIILFRILTSF
jgi:hypothetical protein